VSVSRDICSVPDESGTPHSSYHSCPPRQQWNSNNSISGAAGVNWNINSRKSGLDQLYYDMT